MEICRYLLAWLGYDLAVTTRLPARDVYWLTLSGLLCISAALLFACSGGYLAFLGVYADRFLLPVSVVVAFGIFIFAITMQRLFVTSGGFGYHWDQEKLTTWRPDPFRLVCGLVLAALFSQPYVLLLNHFYLEEKLDERVKESADYFRSSQNRQYDQRIDEIVGRRGVIDENLQLIGNASPYNFVQKNSHPSRRKALLIGVQRYQNLNSLNNPSNDVRDLRAALERMGFNAITSVDGSREDILVAIDAYIKSLKKGDISFLYYSGHGFQRQGLNYIVPKDYIPMDTRSAIKIAPLIDEISRHLPQVNIVLLDACRELPSDAVNDQPSGLADMKAGESSLIVVAAQPGKFAYDGKPGENGVFTAALLRHIERTEDVQVVFGRVTADVVKETSASKQKAQTPVITSSLTNKFVQLAAPKNGKTQGLPAADVAKDALDICGSRSSSDASYPICLLAEARLLDKRLAEIERQRGDPLERRVGEYRASLDRSSMLKERLLIQWSDPVKTTLVTIAGIILMLGGDLLRDLRPSHLRAYERIRNEMARGEMEATYQNVKEKVAANLDGFQPRSYPDIRWHERERFFESKNHAHAPIMSGGSHGTSDQLLESLRIRTEKG